MVIENLRPESIVGNRYRVERLLGQGGLGKVFLARDLLAGEARVALKILASSRPDEVKAQTLRQEFSLLSRLRHPNLVRILDFGLLNDAGGPFLVEEFVDGQDIYQASRRWAPLEVVCRVVAICRAVRFLHSRNIIHRDLKPTNILVHGNGEETDAFKVLDFGLAQWANSAKPHLGVGTLAYTAPEILLGKTATLRSDLYSIGILLYQLLLGRLPFEDDDPGFLIQKQLQGQVDLKALERLECGAGLAQVVGSLLEKDPSKRPSTADDVIRLLGVATRQDFQHSGTYGAEGYFTCVPLVGRERELSLLLDRAARVRANGRGWTVFVTGEGGAGKSRIMEELRICSVLEGWNILEAGCQRDDNRSYAPFRELLSLTDRLTRLKSGSAGEEEIFRFEEVPRVAEKTSLEISNDAAAGSFRDLLTREVVRRLQGRPTILLLHDFHWADEATIAVLDFLSSDIQSHSVLLCVSLRPGEFSDSPLTRLVEQAVRQLRGETLALEPLSKDFVEEFLRNTVSGLDLTSEIVDWAYNSSGGNPFFLEEILKHLVDRGLLCRERGGWMLDRKGWENLEVPANVAVVLRQRLTQISGPARELAGWLAVYNRAVPLELLTEVVSNFRGGLEKPLGELVLRQLVRAIMQDGEEFYEFRHAMISEVIRGDLPTRRRRQMHKRIGEALEANKENGSRLLELAHHFTEGRAGEKAIRYALNAAAACKAEFANEAALRFYEYVLAHGKDLSREQRCEVAIEAADACCSLGRSKIAISMLRRQLRSADESRNNLLNARLNVKLSRAYQFLGDMCRSEQTAWRGLRRLKYRSSSLVNLSSERRAIQGELLYQLAFWKLARSRPRVGLLLLERALSVLQEPQAKALTGTIYSMMSALCRVRCDLKGGVDAGQRSIEILEPLKAYHLLPMAHSHYATNLMALGRFRAALKSHELAVQISDRSRSVVLRVQALANLAECLSRSGMAQRALEVAKKVSKLATAIANQSIDHGCSAMLAEIQISLGDYASARENLERLCTNLSPSIAVYSRAHVLYLSAWLAVELGDLDLALRQLRKLRSLGSTEAPVYEGELGDILRARIHLLQGNLREGLGLLKITNSRLARKHWPYQMCICKLWLAELLMAIGQSDETLRCARGALRLAKAMPSLHLQAHAHLLLARAVYSHLECRAFGKATCANSERISSPSQVIEVRAHLEKAVELASLADAKELEWRSNVELAKLTELTGDLRAARGHAQETLRHLSYLESQVPPQMLATFRRAPERVNARAVCESIIAMRGPDDNKRTSLAVGDIEERHLRILYSASSVINRIRDFDSLLDTIVDLLMQATGVERALVFLKDDMTGRLRFAKGRNLRGESLERAERISQSILEQVHEQGRPFVSAHAQADSRVAERDSVLSYQLGTLMCAPLRAGGRTLGCLYTDHPAPSGSLKESTINLFAAFCNLAAVAIENALIHRQLLMEKAQLEKRLLEVREDAAEMIGKSEAMERLIQQVALISASPLDVLVTGESGTGKELVARALHKSGRRAAGKFVALDCGSLADSLVESELFGYRKGIFTGATENRPGLFEAADGGILFLDEISNLSMKLQGKLLRVLQEREIRRLGETNTRKINVQIVAATNKDLRQELQRGRFRRDLYWRLNSMEIRVPPLRERVGDVPLLVDWILAKSAEMEGGRVKGFSPEAAQLLCDYHYPGNVRQLKNIVQGSYYLAQGRLIGVEHLPAEVRQCEDSPSSSSEGHAEALRIYRRIVQGEGTFAELVKRPYLKRLIGSPTVRGVIHLALQKAKGRYRDAFRLLRIPDGDYTVMMVFLKRHDCDLNYRPYRRKSTLG